MEPVHIIKSNRSLLNQFKRKMQARYGTHPSPFGPCLLAVCDRGVCALSFIGGKGKTAVLKLMRRRLGWADAWVEDASATAPWIQRVFVDKEVNMPIYTRGTPFQEKVWRALRRIPSGQTVSYEEVARMAGRPKAVRAAANAIGVNPAAYLIPCHRVIRKDGSLGGYGWGLPIKKKILDYESGKLP